jgi:hypothetical protein
MQRASAARAKNGPKHAPARVDSIRKAAMKLPETLFPPAQMR